MLTPRVVRGLRWIAFLPTVAAVAYASVFGANGMAGVTDRWPPILVVLSLGSGAAVYLGSQVAPSRRRWPIFLGAGLLLLPLLLGPVYGVSRSDLRTLWWLPVGWVIGVAVGVLLAVRRVRAERLPAVRTAGSQARRYKGTAPFQQSDVDRNTFFGRDREIRSVLSLVLAERLVVLFGKSGMGKSSLINAGLAQPLLERGYFPMTLRLSDRVRGPLGGLLDGVRAAAQAAGVEIVGGDESNLWRFFSTAEFWSRGNDLYQPVLILDQFEELFTLHASEPRHDFILQLADLVRGRAATGRSPAPATGTDARPSKLKIVISLREDYLADLDELARDIPGVLQHRFRIGALTLANAREAIVRPALLEDPAFDSPAFGYREEAVQRILTFLASRRHGDETVRGDEVEPAQLQLVCQHVEDLVRTRTAGRDARTRVEVTEGDLGGDSQLRRVLQNFYDRTVAAIDSPWERRRVRNLCEWHLISGAGRRLTEAEEEIEQKRRVSHATLRYLVDARLLRPDPRLGGVFYELSHDTLVEPILHSRTRRTTRRRRSVAGVLAVAIGASASWWYGSGRQAHEAFLTGKAMALLETNLPGRNDPDAFQRLLYARISELRERLGDGLGSREGYAALMVAADEVRLRYPEYPSVGDSVRQLRHDATQAYIEQFGVQASPARRGHAGQPPYPSRGRHLPDGRLDGRAAAWSDAVGLLDPGARGHEQGIPALRPAPRSPRCS